MAEEVKDKKEGAAPGAEAEKTKVRKKKLRPTNCVQSNKRIRRKDWYYRDGQYFANKKCYKLYVADQAKKKAAEEAKKTTEADKGAA